ncbi:hypothetical protein GCM10027595_12450 [Corynebacterium nasicanis]
MRTGTADITLRNALNRPFRQPRSPLTAPPAAASPQNAPSSVPLNSAPPRVSLPHTGKGDAAARHPPPATAPRVAQFTRARAPDQRPRPEAAQRSANSRPEQQLRTYSTS